MIEMFNTLTKEIKSHDNIVIMGHKAIDLDAYGSALCLYEIINTFGKNVKIYMNREPENKSIQKSMEKLKGENLKISYIYSKEEISDKNSLVIVLDTHKEALLEDYDAIKMYDIFIIDHHVSNMNTIPSLYTYINSDVSSTVEILLSYTKYLNRTISPITATIMLAGLEIDTNSFSVKTTDKTHETAAELIKFGADNIIKQQILKEDKENYCKRQDFVKNSNMITENIALCVMDDNIYKKYMLALISEDLLQFDNVESSFTIGYVDKNVVGISARSIGNIDVEEIMYEMGGGGHKTDAATTITSTTIEKVKKDFINIIKRRNTR